MKKTKDGIYIKSKEDLRKIAQGGEKLAGIKARLKKEIKKGVKATDIEELAVRLIEEAEGKASFKMVEDYSWATCINVNEGIVHGIPKESMVFKKGDVVSVDVGLYYKGFHTDTSFSVLIGTGEKLKKFLAAGKKALEAGIMQAKAGNKVYDISKAIEEVLEEEGASPVRALVGHGIGRNLHESPSIPCFTSGGRKDSPKLPKNCTLAIEVMYTTGSGEVALDDDGWTISTSDGKISALFEETIAVENNGPIIITNPG